MQAMGLVDDSFRLLARAGQAIDDGALTSARHLVARAGRSAATVLDAPLVAGPLNADGRVVLNGALTRIRTAHAALAAGNAADAAAPIGTARGAIDLLLPGVRI
jgi:hypothetical protein